MLADNQSTPPPQDPVFKVGDTVPGFAVTTTAGATVPLKGNGPGRVRAVVFLSSWCEWYLEKTRPETAKACARVRLDVETLSRQRNNIDWVGVAGGPWATAADLADYQAKHKVSLPIGLDVSGKLFRAFGIRDIPTIILIDATGKVLRVIGPKTDNLKAAISVALGGRSHGANA